MHFDTAYPYLGGQSETVMAEALARYPREDYYIADKFPGHCLTEPIDNIALFNISLRNCRTDYFDFYLLHNVMEWSLSNYESEEYHIIPDILKMKEEGKIRSLGFSSHGEPQLLEDFLDRHEGMFDFVQIQLNYLDWTLQDAKKKYEIITRHGLGVWVMEPCRGGKLATLPESESEKLKMLYSDDGSREPLPSDASYAFRFLQSLPNVQVILSGMNEVFQVEDNLRSFREEWPLSDREQLVLMDIAENLKQGVPCTACRYCCDGCPAGLNIPYLLQCYNDFVFDSTMTPSMKIDALEDRKRPDSCIGCGKCSITCPQKIDIPSTLAKLAELYNNGPHWSEQVVQRQKLMNKDLQSRADLLIAPSSL